MKKRKKLVCKEEGMSSIPNIKNDNEVILRNNVDEIDPVLYLPINNKFLTSQTFAMKLSREIETVV